MISFFKSVLMCLSMFTTIPCPVPWEDSLRPKMTAVLGVIGVILGGIWVGIAYLCQAFPPLVTGAFLTICPWFFSGFIHLDGFMDCCDGILSRRGLSDRVRILKDAHCGAFSVISFVCLALVNFSVLASVTFSPLPLVWIATLPRCLSAVAVMTLPTLQGSQYEGVGEKKTALIWAWSLLLLAVFPSFFLGELVFHSTLGAILGWCVACGWGYRSFQGMSGDISGFAITLGECFGLITLTF